MPGAFAAALDALFSDPNIGRDAIWRVGGAGPGVPVRVVLRRPDVIASFGDTRIVTPAMLADLLVSQAPDIAEGDTIEAGGELFLVQGEPVRDAERLVWTIEACAA